MDKIECYRCKYYHMDGGWNIYCKHPKNIYPIIANHHSKQIKKDYWTDQFIKHPKEINANNDCPWYKGMKDEQDERRRNAMKEKQSINGVECKQTEETIKIPLFKAVADESDVENGIYIAKAGPSDFIGNGIKDGMTADEKIDVFLGWLGWERDSRVLTLIDTIKTLVREEVKEIMKEKEE